MTAPHKITKSLGRTDIVQVVMTEELARTFEARCLGRHTRGYTKLSPPLIFGEDDLPTYIISVEDGHDAGENRSEEG